MDFTWGQKVAASDGWAGRLQGVVVTASPWRATHLRVQRGIVITSRRLAPVGLLRRGDTASLALDVELPALLALPKPDAEQGGVTLSASTRVRTPDGAELRLRGMRVVGEIRRLTHLVARRGRQTVLLPVEASDVLGADTARLAQSDATAYRADAEIESDLVETLQGLADVPEVDLNEVRVSVAEGVARLEGNTRSPDVNRAIERAARAVPGCVTVENRLFSDWEINLAAASRISRYAPGLSRRIVVNAQFGVLNLEGAIPDDEAERERLALAVRATPGILAVRWPALETAALPS